MEAQVETKVTGLAGKVKAAALSDAGLMAVCTIWASRERARSQVTVQTLLKSLHDNGFKNFDKQQVTGILMKLANLGLGKLYKDSKGRIRSLIDIKFTLQSIGLAVTGKQGAVAPFKQANKFVDAPVPEVKAPISKPNGRKQYTMAISGDIDGRHISVPLTTEEFRLFLETVIVK